MFPIPGPGPTPGLPDWAVSAPLSPNAPSAPPLLPFAPLPPGTLLSGVRPFRVRPHRRLHLPGTSLLPWHPVIRPWRTGSLGFLSSVPHAVAAAPPHQHPQTSPRPPQWPFVLQPHNSAIPTGPDALATGRALWARHFGDHRSLCVWGSQDLPPQPPARTWAHGHSPATQPQALTVWELWRC